MALDFLIKFQGLSSISNYLVAYALYNTAPPFMQDEFFLLILYIHSTYFMVDSKFNKGKCSS